MAARVTKHLSHEHRLKIQTSQLINRLTEFVNSKIELTPAQVTAALGLLKKSLPDLQAVELSTDPQKPLEFTDVTSRILATLPTEKLEGLLDEPTAQSENYH